MHPFSLSSSARVALSRACNCSKLAKTSSSSQVLLTRRTFSSLPSLRPMLLPQSNTVFRTSTISNSSAPNPLGAADPSVLDLVPRCAITSNPTFSGVQIRCGPRPTMARTSRLVRKRRHGFLSRIRTRTGRRTLQRRKSKNRHMLSN